MLLLAYGTLKQHHRNNHYVENGELLGTFDTKPCYRLFENGSFPMMVADKENGYSVTGEVWEIDDEDVEAIDDHELLYDRREIKMEDDFGEPVFGYIYRHKLTDDMAECYGVWG